MSNFQPIVRYILTTRLHCQPGSACSQTIPQRNITIAACRSSALEFFRQFQKSEKQKYSATSIHSLLQTGRFLVSNMTDCGWKLEICGNIFGQTSQCCT